MHHPPFEVTIAVVLGFVLLFGFAVIGLLDTVIDTVGP
jgi:hypothetical protein